MKKPILQITFNMSELLKKSDYTKKGIRKHYGFNKAQVEALCKDTWTQITRAELQVYLSLAKRTKDFEFLSYPTHPVWSTFGAQPVVIFKGEDEHGPRAADVELAALVLKETGLREQHLKGPPDLERVRRLMQTRNCIFIGSPKYNRATEMALASMWRLKPFQAGQTVAPVRFAWADSAAGSLRSTFAEHVTDDAAALVLRDAPSDKRPTPTEHRLTVTRQGTGKVSGWDFGSFVLCRRPLGATADVTTLVLAGHSAFSTSEMARDLLNGTVYIPHSVEADQPVLRVLFAPWRREGHKIEPFFKGRRWLEPDGPSLNRVLRHIQKKR